jgi:dolichol-phosphate mannosyltransferase
MNDKNKDLIFALPEFKTIEFFPKRTQYCVIIPILNEGSRFRQQLEKFSPYTQLADIIIADGGSTDGSTDETYLKSMGVRTLLIRNGKGKLGTDLRMGYYYSLISSGYSGIITIDGNGKDSVENIPDFIQKLHEGYDFIQGSRFLPGGKENTPLIRYFAMKIIHIPLISILAGYKYSDTTNGYRGHSDKLLLDTKIQIFREIFINYNILAYISVKAPRCGYRVIEIPVSRLYPNGEIPTKISPIKGNLLLLRILWDLIIGKYDYDKK